MGFTYDAVKPHWPLGAVALMVLIPAENMGDSSVGMGMRKARIHRATETADGYRIYVEVEPNFVDLLEVDENGIGDNCEPWTASMEQQYGSLHPERQTVRLPHAYPEPPEFDINEKWAERDSRARKFVQAMSDAQRIDVDIHNPKVWEEVDRKAREAQEAAKREEAERNGHHL